MKQEAGKSGTSGEDTRVEGVGRLARGSRRDATPAAGRRIIPETVARSTISLASALRDENIPGSAPRYAARSVSPHYRAASGGGSGLGDRPIRSAPRRSLSMEIDGRR